MKYDYTKQNIIAALKNIGLKKNDSVFIHSNLGLFGILEGAKTKSDYYYFFRDSIFEVIGDNGTLVIPTFSYSYCRGEVFNVNSTQSNLGYFSEMFRMDPCSKRSMDPNFSIAAQGEYADYYTSYESKYSFDGDCFWKRFLEKGGIFCNFNFDLNLTFIIYVEHQLNVPYRFDKPFQGTSNIGERDISDIYYHFVYDLDRPETKPDYNEFGKIAVEKHSAKEIKLGRGKISLITAEETLRLIKQELINNPNFLIKGNSGEVKCI